MKPGALAIVAAAHAASSLVAFAVIRAVGYDGVTLMFVVGAIVGSWAGFYLRHRAGAAPTAAAPAVIGAVIAATTLAVGVALEMATAAFTYPDIQIGIATIGSFVFPFVLRSTAAKAFAAKS